MFTSIGIGYVIVGALTNDEENDKKYIKAQYFQIGTTLCGIVALLILTTKSREMELPLNERKFTELLQLLDAIRIKLN